MKDCRLLWIILIAICLTALIIIPCTTPTVVEHYAVHRSQTKPKFDDPMFHSRPYIKGDLTAQILYDQSSITPNYKTSLANYWYIPMQEYFDEGMNLYTRPFPTWYSKEDGLNRINPTLTYNEKDVPNPLFNYVVRGPISEYCFKKRIEETGDLRYSLAACDITMAQKMTTGKIMDNDNNFLPSRYDACGKNFTKN